MEHSQSNLIGVTTAGLFLHGFHAMTRVGGRLGAVFAPLVFWGLLSVGTPSTASRAGPHFPVSHP